MSAVEEEMSINMEFRNVVFNAARDGKLRRLKVSFWKRKKNKLCVLLLLLAGWHSCINDKYFKWRFIGRSFKAFVIVGGFFNNNN